MRARFWERYALADLAPNEWEALCDGCGRCCLNKLEDEDSGEVVYTRVACALLHPAGGCRDYPKRQEKVPSCVALTAENVATIAWLPRTCAYRLRAQGRPLYDWHPLISGTALSVQRAGISVVGRCVSETLVAEDDLEAYVVRWKGL